ncbi:MAG: penicillin-binding protein [Comamonadaceae bacterium]|nr:MAG: penicillin-binding protein [Comamonadaceae bacterium]
MKELPQSLRTLGARLKALALSVPDRLRHPSRRGVLLTLVGVPAALVIFLVLYILVLIPFTPSISDLRKAKTARPSVVMSSDGQVLATFQRANRDWVQLSDISPQVVAALISTEDHRFYEHHGMDFKRTLSAVFHTATGDMQGGSTITQQLARNLYPEEIGRSATLTRKLKEAITALKIESVYSKDEILATYLNTVPFLYNAYGIEMAARTYFDTSADKLDILESATLVGMLKGTSYYNPVQNPDRALQRRNIVLGQMAKHEKIDDAQLAALKKRPLKIDFERQTDQVGAAPHLAQQLKRWLIEWADRNDYNIYADGLVLRTTIDSRLQEMANDAVTRQMDRLQKSATADWGVRSAWEAKSGPRRAPVLAFLRDTPEYKAARAQGQTEEDALKALQADTAFMKNLREEKTRLQTGFVAMDPATGHVKAWVGSRGFLQDQFDHVQTARRQPGSTFKPFVYGAAFENGTKPTDGFMDQAVEIVLPGGQVWRPSDGGGPSGMPMTLRQGLMYSKNTITAQVMQVVGPAHVAKLARSLGVRQSKLEEVPSLALGTSPVTLKEMVSAYSSIANDGRYIEPIMVTQVEDRNGGVLEAFTAKPAETAMESSVAQTLLDVLRGVVDQGTGGGIRSRFGIRADVAGKTGTTQDNTDGWFILMSPQLVAGAWVGFNDNRVTMGGYWGQGAHSALPVVGDFFQQAYKSKSIDAEARFTAPQGVSEPAPGEPAFDMNGPLNGELNGEPGGVSPNGSPGMSPGWGEPADLYRGASAPPPENVPGGVRYVNVQAPGQVTPQSDAAAAGLSVGAGVAAVQAPSANAPPVSTGLAPVEIRVVEPIRSQRAEGMSMPTGAISFPVPNQPSIQMR